MELDPITLLDAEIALLIERIAKSGLEGETDQEALHDFERLSEKRVRMTEPELEPMA